MMISWEIGTLEEPDEKAMRYQQLWKERSLA